MKRTFDVLVALLALLVAGPLMLVVALLVRLDSPGPVLFRQERVGRYGRHFKIRKFRTMVVDQSQAARQITVGADPRITRIGRILRASKLDELPQLIDVLTGSMSFVGPRPEVPRYVEHYPPEAREKVLSVRPGITDLGSIHFRNESELLGRVEDPERVYIEQILPMKLRYALRYVESASIINDLKVLGLTARAVLLPNDIGVQRPMTDSNFWKLLDRFTGKLHRHRRLLSLLADSVAIAACWFLAYLFRLGFERLRPERPDYDTPVLVCVVLLYLVALSLSRTPTAMWRYWSLADVKRLTMACLVAGVCAAAAISMLQLSGIPRAVLVLHPIFCVAGLCGLRLVYRLVFEHMRLRVDSNVGELRHAIVLGAGDAARRLLAGIHLRDGWNVLGLLDDDPAKQGATLAGVPVLGPLSRINDPVVYSGATHIIVAMPGATPEQRASAVSLAVGTGLVVLTLPSASELRAPE